MKVDNKTSGYIPDNIFYNMIFKIFGLFFNRRHKAYRIQAGGILRIVVFKAGAIGDTVFILPIIHALKKRYPDTKIDILCYSKAVNLFEEDPAVNNVYSYRFIEAKRFKDVVRCNTLKDVIDLKAKLSNADILISLNRLESLKGILKYALVSYLIKAKVVIGLNTKGRGFFLTHKVYDQGYLIKHEIDIYYRILESLGVEEKGNTEVYVSDKEIDFTNKIFKKEELCKKKIIIGLHPGGGSDENNQKWIMKRWSVKNYCELINKLNSYYKIAIILIGGSNEHNLSDEIRGGVKAHIIDLVGSISLRQLAAIAKRCHLFIGNDTGPMHIAAAMNVPTFTIFGYSDFIGYAPRGNNKNNYIIKRNFSCSPCVYWFEKRKCYNTPCITNLSVDTVFETIKSYINQNCLDK